MNSISISPFGLPFLSTKKYEKNNQIDVKVVLVRQSTRINGWQSFFYATSVNKILPSKKNFSHHKTIYVSLTFFSYKQTHARTFFLFRKQ